MANRVRLQVFTYLEFFVTGAVNADFAQILDQDTRFAALGFIRPLFRNQKTSS